MKRIKLDTDLGGDISLEGVAYSPDELGCYSLPDHHAENLIRMYGGKYAPGFEALQATLVSAQEAVAAAENVLEVRKKGLKTAQDNIETFKKLVADAEAASIAKAKSENDAKLRLEAEKGKQQNQGSSQQQRR
jgi:hypothetical protein